MPESADLPQLLAQAADGDETALTQLFCRYRKRLKQMVRLRLNRQLQGRIDDSDILEQLTNAEVAATLEMNESTASSRYLRALKRLKDELSQFPGLFGG